MTGNNNDHKVFPFSDKHEKAGQWKPVVEAFVLKCGKAIGCDHRLNVYMLAL